MFRLRIGLRNHILWLFFSEAIIHSSSSYRNVKISPILLLYNFNVLHLHVSFYYHLSEYDAHGTWLSVGLAKNYSLGPGTWPFPIWVNNNIPFCKCKNCFCFSLGKKIQDLKNSMGISNCPNQMLWLIYSSDYRKFMLCDVLLKQLPTAFTCNWWNKI